MAEQPDDTPHQFEEQAEPWASWETRLCLWSLGIGIGALAVLGVLVNLFLL